MDKGNGKSKVIAWINNHKLILGSVLCMVLTVTGFSVLFCMDNGYNYISALANVVIATSAVMAYLTARNYLPQLTTQEGYKIAIQMVNNELQSTGVINSAVVFARKLDVFLRNRDDKRVYITEHRKLLEEIKKFADSRKEVNRYEDKINQYISTMTTYGLKPAPDREVYFKGFCQSLNQINITLLDVEIVLQFYSNSHSSKVTDPKDTSFYKFHYIEGKNEMENYKNMQTALSSLVSAYNTLESNRLSFFGEKKQIGRLFVVNLD